MLVPLLTVCDTDTRMLHSSSNYLSHTMRFLDTHTTTFKAQQKSEPKKLQGSVSHPERGWGGAFLPVSTGVSLPVKNSYRQVLLTTTSLYPMQPGVGTPAVLSSSSSVKDVSVKTKGSKELQRYSKCIYCI